MQVKLRDKTPEKIGVASDFEVFSLHAVDAACLMRGKLCDSSQDITASIWFEPI